MAATTQLNDKMTIFNTTMASPRVNNETLYVNTNLLGNNMTEKFNWNLTEANLTTEQARILEAIHISFLALHYLISFGILLFNGVFIATVIWSYKLKKIENAFLVKLAVFDILSGVSVILNSSADVIDPMPKGFCLVAAYVTGISFIGSFYSLMDISLERYYKVSHALTYMRRITKKSTTVYVTCELIFIGLVTATNALLAKYQDRVDEDEVERCMPLSFTNQYAVAKVIVYVVLGVPLAITTVVYIRLTCIARKHRNAMKKQTRAVSTLAIPTITVHLAARSDSLGSDSDTPVNVLNQSSRISSSASLSDLTIQSVNSSRCGSSASLNVPKTSRRGSAASTGSIDRKRISMLGIILLMQYLCIFPSMFNNQLVRLGDLSFALTIVSKVLRESLNGILFVNSMINPLIYQFRCREIKTETRKLFQKVKQCLTLGETH